MSEILCLKIAVALWLIHVLLQGGIGNVALPRGYLSTARDEPVKPDSVYWGRATRALANYVENFVAFAALDLGLIATNHGGGYGATLWILARVIYIPLYLFGVIYLRTVVWAVSLVGLVMMWVQLAA